MTDLQLKDRLAYILFGAKFIVVSSIFILWCSGGFNFQQMSEILVIVIPLFSVHLTMIIKDYLETKEDKSLLSRPLRKPLVVLSQALPLGYTLYMILVVVGLSNVSGDTSAAQEKFAQMKTLLGIGEIIFGVYLGIIISTMFKPGKAVAKNDNQGIKSQEN